MSVGLASEEVAEDYKNSLEDLTLNSRYEISNLTVIAKENTEHAEAISRVLENHIRNTAPDRKLPALYVLDSVVKNVGTPYTLFLGRNLYSTFMGAYSLVNNQIRKKLDEMLKTWKEPVPGSLDTRPVFPVNITRNIENALIKARTAAVQQQQKQARSQQQILGRSQPLPGAPWQQTPTPPQSALRYPPPSSQNYGHPQIPNGNIQIRSPYPSPSQFPTPQPSQPQFQGHFQPQNQPHPLQQSTPAYGQFQANGSFDSLNQDIENLIFVARREWAANVGDVGIQTRLKALLDLQSILKNQQLPPHEMQQIQNQVASLAAQAATSSSPASLPPAPISVASPPQVLPNVPPPTQTPVDLQALLNSSALTDLWRSVNFVQPVVNPPPTPQISLQQPETLVPQPTTNSSQARLLGESSLVASLRASGLLPPVTSAPASTPAVAAQAPFSFPSLSSIMQNPPPPPTTSMQATKTSSRNDVELTSASLKVPRPHLISKLYEARPNQCRNCGKRFLATEEGRTKKARHLDWHFRTNQRLADSAKRGQSRSWYVDELEWIKSRDNEEDGNDQAPNGTGAPKTLAVSTAAKNENKDKFIIAPSDKTLANAPCPICQEKFVSSWSDEIGDFVWKDAIRTGGRIYHASCYAEMRKDGGNTPVRTSTPDSVLGKRKAEVADGSAVRTKLQRA